MTLNAITCQHCGTQNFRGNLICKDCGQYVSGVSSAKEIPDEAAVINRSAPFASFLPASQPQSNTWTGNSIILALIWLGVIGAVVLAALSYTAGMAEATTVFQQITTIANSLLWIIGPYCFARAVTEIAKLD